MTTPRELKNLYSQGKNISEILRKEIKSDKNTKEIIEISYDPQAGSYISALKDADHLEYRNNYTSEISKTILELCNPTTIGCHTLDLSPWHCGRHSRNRQLAWREIQAASQRRILPLKRHNLAQRQRRNRRSTQRPLRRLRRNHRESQDTDPSERIIIHMLSPDQTRVLLKKAWKALAIGGRILVKDFFLEDSRIAPAWTAQFSVNMLVNTEGGKSYPLTEMQELLAEAGFKALEMVDIAHNSRVIVGQREF